MGLEGFEFEDELVAGFGVGEGVGDMVVLKKEVIGAEMVDRRDEDGGDSGEGCIGLGGWGWVVMFGVEGRV